MDEVVWGGKAYRTNCSDKPWDQSDEKNESRPHKHGDITLEEFKDIRCARCNSFASNTEIINFYDEDGFDAAQKDLLLWAMECTDGDPIAWIEDAMVKVEYERHLRHAKE